MRVSYILPVRSADPAPRELDDYLGWLSTRVELIVVDGSQPHVFDVHAERWVSFAILHVPVDPAFTGLLNGKVAGVLTGLKHATHEYLIVADDDVRYDVRALERVQQLLAHSEVVRPQNYFVPLPWHAWLDTGRTLLNRVSGGDWPGTLGVRRSALLATDGYDGNVLFENLELVRTIAAAGGRELNALDLYVPRRPPSTKHFWSQRVRQAYDEFARPVRLLIWLAVVPAVATVLVTGRWRSLVGAGVTIAAVAEVGRRRRGGSSVFPFVASLAAPLWVLERGLCAWMAAASRVARGGIRYRGHVITRAATPLPVLERRHVQQGRALGHAGGTG